MRPYLEKLVGPNMVVGNSESLAWLQPPELEAKPGKPDNFWCPRPTFQSEPLADGPNAVFPVINRGRPAHPVLYESVHLADCKCKITNTAFGELVIHLRHLAAHSKVRTSGCIYDCTSMKLVEIEPVGGTVIRFAALPLDAVCQHMLKLVTICDLMVFRISRSARIFSIFSQFF